MTVRILGGIVVSKHHYVHINNLNYWETWAMIRLRDFSSVLIVIVIIITKISPLGSITPVSLHKYPLDVHCIRVAVACVPNSISPFERANAMLSWLAGLYRTPAKFWTLHALLLGFVLHNYVQCCQLLMDFLRPGRKLNNLFTTNRGLDESLPLANWQIGLASFCTAHRVLHSWMWRASCMHIWTNI